MATRIFDFLYKGRPKYTFDGNDITLHGKRPDLAMSGLFLTFVEFPSGFPTELKQIIEPQYNVPAMDIFPVFVREVSVPDINLEMFEIKTVEFAKIQLPGEIEYSQSVTEKITEFSSGSFRKFLSSWFFMARKTHTFVDDSNKIDKEYLDKAKKLKINQMLIVTDRYLHHVTFSCIFMGMFPRTLPLSVFSSSVGNVNIIEYDISFSFDFMLVGSKVDEVAKEKLKMERQYILQEFSSILNS